MDVRFEHRDAFCVSGYAKETDLASCGADLALLWDRHEDDLRRLPESQSCLYGVMWYTENHKYFYLLGIEKQNKSNMDTMPVTTEIPAAYFAVATVPDKMTVVDAWTEYFEKELPARGFIPDAEHGKYFEFHGGNGICELWTPVTPAEQEE